MPIVLKEVGVKAPDSPEVTLLQDISFTLQEGSVTLLIGHAGSGKSTLLQVMSGLLKPQAGSITVDEQPIWLKPMKADPKQLLRFGLTFQFPEQQLFARSIGQEFAYSLRPYKLAKEERDRRIRAATHALDPHGVFAMDRSPFALSGGEQRRLALATTFATAPDWLLMDEPTAGLEAAAVRELLRMLRERSGRGGLVVATHDLDTFFPLADRVLVLDHGELVFDGSPQELCRAPEVLARAGVGLPSCAEAAVEMARVGIAIAPDLLTPALAASAILAALREAGSASAPAAPLAAASVAQPPRPAQRQALAPEPPAPQAGWLGLDPRAKWLLYLLLAIGTMGQQGWGSLAVAAALVGCAFLGLPRSVLRGIRKIATSYAIFLIFSVALAGIEFSPIGYSVDNGWSTTFILTRLFVVLMAGCWLAMSTPYSQLVQGLNWALKYLYKVKLPVASFSLAVSFVFRFIPLIMREWQQFSTIVRARGKASVRPGTVRVRDIPALVVPLLLGMFHKAEQMTVAMEMKQIDGTTLLLRKDTLEWARADTVLVVVALLAWGFLLFT
ncbi:Energy-coupling factor transporter transmembrane protein EcfT [Paenibacillus allorhizoplanae]|uniref:Energy-coupling factor transporter transmembrane protein EcfT n=1 Tax=Paenibacillus allorhizoplanae TaxID=2905648 RepID=A0ABM9CGP4_9BACL|nr:ATP-binding cassette domain-containing protein [Paenibacillus allorhizoplanae]CAH1213310.1 Energy-coupling factor transporter transmembrane protein EcfT [Paenibacillus allorhizoplanae]